MATTTPAPIAPPSTVKPGVTTSEALLVLVAFLAILGISVGWIPTPPNVSALATQIVLAALTGVYALARTYLKANAPAALPPSVQQTIQAILASLVVPRPSPTPTATATERAPQSGRVRGSMLGVMSGVACIVCALAMGLGQPACKSAGGVGTTIGSAAGSALACTENDLSTVVGSSGKTLVVVVALDLLEANYAQAIAATEAELGSLGESLVRCAIVFIDDVGGAIEGALVVTSGSGATPNLEPQATQRATIAAHAKAIRAAKGW